MRMRGTSCDHINLYILFYFILFYFILFYFILFYFLVGGLGGKKRERPHCAVFCSFLDLVCIESSKFS
jgi:hypothetical protein